MGTSSSLSSFTSEYSQLQYYTIIEDPVYGNCQVYSSNKFAGCYIIKIITTQHHVNNLQLFSKVENQQNIYLLGLYGYRAGKNCHCKIENIISNSVISYWEYLSYSLRDVIEYRKRIGVRFHEIEIWHIIKACIYGYQTFQKLYISYDFMPSKLMVNLQGRIRLNWMHVQQKNQHTNFVRKMNGVLSVLENQEYLAPQQLQAFQHKQFTPKINYEKTNTFSLGMALLQCITLLNPITNFYMNLKVNYPRIEEIMASPQSKIYSQSLLMLIGSMLRHQPIYRPSFQGVITNYSSFMNRDYSILIRNPTFSHENQWRNTYPHVVKPKSVGVQREVRRNF